MKLNKKGILITGIGIISLPLFISILCWIVDFFPQILFFKIGSNSDWIAFWGSVSGAIFGVFGTYQVLRIQLENEKKQYEEAQKRYEETQIDNTFFNMVDLFQIIKGSLKPGSTSNLLTEMEKRKREDITLNIRREKRELYEKDKNIIDKAVNNLASSELMETNTKDYIEALSVPGHSTDEDIIIFTQIYPSMIADKNFVCSTSESVKRSSETLDKVYEDFKKIDEKYKKITFNEEAIFNLVNNLFALYHAELGTFLRMFHRIVKYIMDSDISIEQKKEYLGMLRALLSSEEILVIFYNTFYTDRGKGLKKQLDRKIKYKEKEEYTEFFADEHEIKDFVESKGKIDLPFFKFQDLVFPDSDLNKIMNLTNYNENI